jgi:hypothetical protein
MAALAAEVETQLPGVYPESFSHDFVITLDRTEKHGDRVSAYSRPGGTNGTNGSPGNRAATYLTGGKASVLVKLITVLPRG